MEMYNRKNERKCKTRKFGLMVDSYCICSYKSFILLYFENTLREGYATYREVMRVLNCCMMAGARPKSHNGGVS